MTDNYAATSIHLRLNYTVRDLTVPDDVVYRFQYGDPHHVLVELRAPNAAEQAGGHKQHNAFCVSHLVIEPNARNLAVFRRIEANEMIPPGGTDEQLAAEYTGPNGSRIRIPALSAFPEPFQTFLTQIQGELSDYARRTVATLRWRLALRGPHDPISTRGMEWSVDGLFWHIAPARHGLRANVLTAARATAEQLEAVCASVAAGASEPLDHEMLREAWEQRHTNPRSALVVGIAAAELGVKRCIATLVPDAKWMAMNLPTPPLVQIVTEFLPTLPARHLIGGQVKALPKAAVDALKKAVTVRNQLVHAGKKRPTGTFVEETLLAVQDLLWLLEYYVGAEWAFSNLRQETRDALESAI